MRYLLAALALVSGAAHGLTIVPDCNDWIMRQTDKGMEFRCQSAPNAMPWFTLGGCLEATARRDRVSLRVTITCDSGPCAGQRFTILPRRI